VAKTIPEHMSPKKIPLSDNARANEILEVIMAFARQDFNKKVSVESGDSVLDGIGAGVNMLGEELQHSTISLREKEQLLKEIHHRVKNNMQIISSLLSLQSENSDDGKFNALLRESRNRINSMALVHEMLYQSDDLSKIELKEYIETLCSSVHRSYVLPDSVIEFDYAIEKQEHFNIDKMIPIGLILNEAISNSLKHAFPQKKGKVTITLQRQNDKYSLTVSDNGLGFKNDFDPEKDSHLGIQLIYMLTEQLGGKLEVLNSKGVNYHIVF
jgi:two-component sensor histidine kinase